MSQRVVRNVENDYLMCSICLGRYENPKLIPCGHTFCKQCLSDHITLTVTDRGASYFHCPNDRTQITRPAPGLHPKQWADAFPTDSFLDSLLQAVRIHEGSASVRQPSHRHQQESVQSGDNTAGGPVCSEHPGRLLEFFCLGCNALVCPYCAVRRHRSQTCECVPVSEAYERFRPRVQALRRRLEAQMSKIRQVNSGETILNGTLQSSKDRANYTLDKLENQLARFYQVVLQYIEDVRQQVREAGLGQMTENRQLSILLDNIDCTRISLENMYNTNSESELLNDLPKIEAQADEYDSAMQAAATGGGTMQVEFVPNAAFQSFLRSPPTLGSIKISSDRDRPQLSPYRNIPTQIQARPNQSGQRQIPTAAVRPTQTPRPARQTAPRQAGSQRTRRSMTKINVKVPSENVTAWQITGVAFVGFSAVMADNLNHMIRQVSLSGSLVLNQTLAMEHPLCVCSLTDRPTEVAVTQPEKRQISIVTTEGGLRPRETIQTHKGYDGISHLPDGRFVVSCVQGRQSIDIIDQGGRMLKCLDRPHLYNWPRFLSTTSTGNILVSDRDKKHVICMDHNGHIEWTYSTPSSPWGVACDHNGKIFLCLDNNSVQILSEDGDVINEKFIKQKDGIKTPYAICARPNQVVISEFGSSLFVPNSCWIYTVSY